MGVAGSTRSSERLGSKGSIPIEGGKTKDEQRIFDAVKAAIAFKGWENEARQGSRGRPGGGAKSG